MSERVSSLRNQTQKAEGEGKKETCVQRIEKLYATPQFSVFSFGFSLSALVAPLAARSFPPYYYQVLLALFSFPFSIQHSRGGGEFLFIFDSALVYISESCESAAWTDLLLDLIVVICTNYLSQ